MNTTLRTSVHTCIVTREAIDFLAEKTNGWFEIEMMAPVPVESVVSIKTLIPPSIVEGGHIRAVFELTERVDT